MISSRRKTLHYLVTYLFFLCGGIEYAIVLPTLWLFLSGHFQSTHWFYGLTFASFSISGLLAGPLVGYVSDRLGKGKALILFCNLFEVGGNFLYFAAQNKYMVLGGRLLAGVGAGAGAAIFAALARSSTKKERTRTFAAAMACRYIGLLAGPGLNFFISRAGTHHFNSSLTFDKYTAPGIIMSGVWVLVEILMFIFYIDLPPLKENEDKDNDDERKPLVNRRRTDIQSYGSESLSETAEDAKPLTCCEKLLDMMREEWVVLLASQFILFFNQTAVETMVVPLSKKYMGWGVMDCSLFYCGTAVEGIILFVFIRWLSRRLDDRWILLIGVLAMLISMVWLLVLLPSATPEKRTYTTWVILVGAAIDVVGLTFFAVSVASLFSKVTSMKYQGTSQGIRRSVVFTAMIMGPLFAGAYLQYLTAMVAVLVSFCFLVLVLVLLSFKKLKEPAHQAK